MSINPPDGSPEEPDAVVPPEPVVPPQPVVPPYPAQLPYSGQSPYPAQPPHPAQLPYSGQPPHAGQPQFYGQVPQMPYGMPPGPPYGQKRGLGNGAKIGIGSGIGCLSYVVAFFLFLGTMSVLSQAGPAAYFVIFGLPVLVGVGLLFSPRTRGFGVGILIVAAAGWLVVLGPCSTLLFA
ncbi:MAG: hypothetical protein JF592_15600 [Microbacterium sp.]|uniref:hypothetical protein n=1 Tax=Microbacterium sp. TaxID=51671 RepID=UPI001DCAD6D9|nr:hypothetical protein [Microbacterium sp.]MBW8763980.1 hypothetical protein [Microbacterium sp.]